MVAAAERSTQARFLRAIQNRDNPYKKTTYDVHNVVTAVERYRDQYCAIERNKRPTQQDPSRIKRKPQAPPPPACGGGKADKAAQVRGDIRRVRSSAFQ